ncbi:VOC family protein [Trinickia fusca]|uniref:Glyoxalase n=1 Tax=Trinickia fusca TaxID=2419777 RepID=A0A494X4D0_9BURK|nr:VOC family protein [Trinickia fusca]RKP45547.1 glyoxalase [Trinickia fusca]
MQVKRIVANVATPDVDKDRDAAFYRDILGLDVLMDHGWIVTFGLREPVPMQVQISVASQGGSDTPVPDLSIEVDDIEAAYERVVRAGVPIEYGPIDEPWGVRRFYVRDPFGKLVNLLAHR